MYIKTIHKIITIADRHMVKTFFFFSHYFISLFSSDNSTIIYHNGLILREDVIAVYMCLCVTSHRRKGGHFLTTVTHY